MDVREETRRPRGRVLEDPSGTRRRRLRLIGRAIAVVAFVWLALVLLGGIGVGPAAHLPLGHALRASAGPPPLRTVPTPTPPSPADLRPALPAPPVHGRPAARPRPAAARGRSASAPGHLRKTKTRGRPASAPGRARKPVVTTTTAATTTNPAGHPVHRRRGHTR